MRTLCLLLSSTMLLISQQSDHPLVTIHPLTEPIQQIGPSDLLEAAKTPTRHDRLTVVAGLPIAGYIPGDRQALTSVAITGIGPVLCGAVMPPPATTRLYLPPRQMYALVESSLDNPIAVWQMHVSAIAALANEAVAIDGALAHPDMVIFSALGDSALLYSAALGKLQLIRSIPSNAYATDMPSIDGSPLLLAVSDDAAVIVALLNDGRVVSSWNRGPWNPIDLAGTPSTLLFMPHTHDLIISDATDMTVTVLPLSSDVAEPPRLLLQNKRVDELAASKTGELLAANTSSGDISVICVKTGVSVSRDQAGPIHALLELRDGVTFLVSTNQGWSVLKIAATPGDGNAIRDSYGAPNTAISK